MFQRYSQLHYQYLYVLYRHRQGACHESHCLPSKLVVSVMAGSHSNRINQDSTCLAVSPFVKIKLVVGDLHHL